MGAKIGKNFYIYRRMVDICKKENSTYKSYKPKLCSRLLNNRQPTTTNVIKA